MPFLVCLLQRAGAPAGSSGIAAGDTTCKAATCNAVILTTDGAPGNCTDTFLSGSTCLPTCKSGYTISGSSRCNAGLLVAVTCDSVVGGPFPAACPEFNSAIECPTDTCVWMGKACEESCFFLGTEVQLIPGFQYYHESCACATLAYQSLYEHPKI